MGIGHNIVCMYLLTKQRPIAVMLTSFIRQYWFSFYKFPNVFSSLANSFSIAMCHLMWLLSRKYGTVWYHPASSKSWHLTALSFVNFQEKLTGTSCYSLRVWSQLCSACCVFGARCTFCVNRNLGYHGAFSRMFLSHDGISAITEPFHKFFFHTMEFTRCTHWGKTLFIYITKSIYTGPASLKTLPLELEPPLQGKE
jgi:hypothetical protein